MGAASLVTSILRIAGTERRAVGSLRLRFIFADPDVLQEGEGDHGECGMVMQAVPRAALEVIEAEFLFHLLVRLLACPARFDACSEHFE